MSKSKIMKVFHQYNKDYLLSCGFTKVNDVYVKFSQEKDCLIKIDFWLLAYVDGLYLLEPMLSYPYLYGKLCIDDLIAPDSRGMLLSENINGFLPGYFVDKNSNILKLKTPENHNYDHNNIYLEAGLATLSSKNNNVMEIYMKAILSILQNDLKLCLHCNNYSQAMDHVRAMHAKETHKTFNLWLETQQHNLPWGYLVLHNQTESYINVEEFKYLNMIEKIQKELNLHLITVNETLSMISLTDSDSESGRKQRKSLENQLESAQNNVFIYQSKLDVLLGIRDEWRKRVSQPEADKVGILLEYEKNILELSLIMEGKKSKPKVSQKVIPQRTPVIDNLERIVIRRGSENWKQIQTYMDEFFKTKGYHRTSDREMWERTWCIVETQNFWIIMELDESGITNEHLNDYDQLSKRLTKVLVTSGFFLYSFEFSESLARLYDQGECVDHWVIDEGFEVDEQEISQPLAWESSKIANPYRLKDPEEVHLIDIIYDWMEMLKINPQWMVEEVESTQNFKKCHIFGYAGK
jgi:hypothetical protein